MTAHIYGEQNAGRSPESTFSHFVEVCGMLSSLERKKARGEVNFVDALCKALGWFFPLLAKFKVRSVESLVFRKYPMVCPYCRRSPHSDENCKSVLGTAEGVVDHSALRTMSAERLPDRPSGLDAWQAMFQRIYPRTADDRSGRSVFGLMEELGEFAEAIRVFDVHPEYLAGEAADVFSYLMGLANEHMIRVAQESGAPFSFESQYLQRYPGLCTACGESVCRCPHVPEATVGRLAKELGITADEQLFNGYSYSSRIALGDEASKRVLNLVGGYPGVLARFPLDRGQANRHLVEASMKLSVRIAEDFPVFANLLNVNAFKLLQATTPAGQRQHSPVAREIVDDLMNIFRDPQIAEEIKVMPIDDEYLAKAAIPRERHVLFVSACPDGEDSIRSDRELRQIREAIRRTKYNEKFKIETLLASTSDDLRRAILEKDYEILHISCHGDESGLILESEDGSGGHLSYSALSDYLSEHPSIRCIILNGCQTADAGALGKAEVTVGMQELVEDPAAIAFARGFYDGVAAEKDFALSAKEGEYAMRFAGHDATVFVTAQPLTPLSGG